jgi:hypothetical protein
MTKNIFITSLLCVFSLSCFGLDKPSAEPSQGKVMGGEEGSACQMLLCLSDPSGGGLKECSKPLKDYFSMDAKDRPGFLKKCPMVAGGNNK